MDLGGYYFAPEWSFHVLLNHFTNGYGIDSERRFPFWREGAYYGVNKKGVTLYATDRCTWFMSEWTTRGKCW